VNAATGLTLAALAAVVTAATSPAQDVRRPPTAGDRAHVAALGWKPAAEKIGRALVASYHPGRAGTMSSVASASFQSWLLLAQWAELLSRDGHEGLDPAFLEAMTGDETFLRTLFANLSDRDISPRTLKILETIWKDHPGQWKDYQNLAIAIAIVRDQNPPATWPHPQVDPALVPLQAVDPSAAFAFWAASNERSRLLADLRKMPPDLLKFVIDAPVDPREFEWAQANVRFPRAEFDRTFSAIDYAHERIPNREFVWTGAPYTLEAIQARGGICVDQAYFAMLSGKARGLPTLFFTGQGADGGHAWFGYLKGGDRWELDCGRYLNQNYAVGEALDPQTWLAISDHELESLAQNFRRSPQYLASRADLALARLAERIGDSVKALEALDSAIDTSPRNDLAWDAKTDFLTRANAGGKALRAHHEAALKPFANDNDLKVHHQRALAALARQAGDESAAQGYETQIISQNRRDRTDLSIGAAARKLRTLVEAGQLDAAMREYRSLISRLGRTGGGNFFYEIVDPFSRTLLAHHDAPTARRVVELARGALRPESGSILDQDFETLEGEIGKAANP